MRNRALAVIVCGALAAAGCCVLFLRGADAGKVRTTSTFAESTELPTWGASGVVAADLNRDGQPDLVFLNKMDGKDQDPLDSWIYYGNERGEFSAASRQALPVRPSHDECGRHWEHLRPERSLRLRFRAL